MRIAVKPMPQGGAVSWFRGTGPAEYVKALGHDVAILHSSFHKPEVQREIVRTADVVHVLGWSSGSYEKAPSEFRERRGALSVDLDDDVWVWLDDPARKGAEEAGMHVAAAGSVAVSAERVADLASWLEAADVVTTTTAALAQTIRERVPKARVRVIQNAIPPEAQRARPRRADSNVLKKAGLRPGTPRRVVGWTGSIAHVPDLTPLLAALARIRSVDGTLEVRSLGPVDFMESQGFAHVFRGDTDYRPMVHHDIRANTKSLQVPFELYYDFLEQMEPDVAAIPMRDSAFNRGKSAVTLYSWAAQGVPVVCSDVGPYAEAKAQGFPARYVPHDDRNAWTAALRELLYEPGARLELGREAHAWVMKRHAFPEGARPWVEAWAEAAARSLVSYQPDPVTP